jgi:CheY-like chemotaxis protein
MKLPTMHIPIEILLADDDSDDRFFFDKALKAIPFQTQLTTIEDGEKLMVYLRENSERLPDVLFLDYNMPKKNGFECLVEIKQNAKLKALPVILYSTYLHQDIADILYQTGAHFYVRKTGFIELKTIIHNILTLIVEDTFVQPPRENFTLSLTEA